MTSSSHAFGLRQTAKNILFNSINFIVSVLIGFWYTPFLLSRLGSALFGFIPLATSVTNYFSILTYSLNISIGRNITLELERGDTLKANQLFNTTQIAILLLILLSIPLSIVLVIFVPTLFEIPVGRERDVQLLFTGVIAAFLLGTYGINYSLATFAKNRFDLRTIVALGARIVQILIIIALFSANKPNLIHVGLGAIGAALFNLIGDYYLWRILLPALRARWKDFRKSNLALLFRTGGWTFVYQAGFVLFLNIDLLVANRILDFGLAGMYGALLIIPKNLRMMSMAIGGVWGPSVLAKYSKFDIQGMDEIVGTGVKLMGFVLALTVGLLCGLAGPFLDIWLGSDFRSLTWVLVIMLFPLATNLIVTPFFYIHVSFNKLKIPALVELGLGLSNLFLAICLTPQYKTMGLVLAGGLTLTLYFSIFAPVYAAKIMGLPWTHYLKRLGLITLSTLGVTLVAYFLNKTIPLTSYLHLIIGAGLISTGYLALVYFLGLSSTEKELMESFLSKETGNNQNGYNDPL